jgi:hypothetical protein
MRMARSVGLAALAFLAGVTFAAAETALGPALSYEGGFPAPGKVAFGGAFFGDYGPFYFRISGAYSPMPSREEGYADWPPASETDDRGYAAGEVLGVYSLGGATGLGPGFYYGFGRSVRDYYYYIYGPTLTLETEDFVAFQHDFLAVAACRLQAEGTGKAVVWAGAGVSRFLRSGLLYSWYSDFYNPEYTYEESTSLDTRLTALAIGVGGDIRSGFAKHFGIYASTRFLFPTVDLSLTGYDGDKPDPNVALAGGFFVAW